MEMEVGFLVFWGCGACFFDGYASIMEKGDGAGNIVEKTDYF
jgi:hypothetical protein